MKRLTATLGTMAALTIPDVIVPNQNDFNLSMTPYGCIRLEAPATIGPSTGRFIRFDCRDDVTGTILTSISYQDDGPMGFMSFGVDSCFSSDGVSLPAIAQDDIITCGESMWQYAFDDIRLIYLDAENEKDDNNETHKRLGNAKVQWTNV